MTQPDQTLPPSAFNYGSLAELAAKTEEEWRAELESNATASHNEILAQLYNDLPADMPFPLALLTVIARGMVNDPEKTWDSIVELVTDIPVLGTIADSLDIVKDRLTQIFGDIFVSFDLFAALTHFFEMVAQVGVQIASDFAAFIALLLGVGSTADDLVSWLQYGLWGQIDPRRITVVPASAVVDIIPNALLNGNFDTSRSIRGELNWEWDSTEGHTTLGCAKVTCDGNLRELVSNPINVHEGEAINLSVFVKWSGLEYTGTNPISLGVDKYFGGNAFGSDDLDSFATPAESSDWTTDPNLSEVAYIVPEGIDQLLMRFKVDGNATAGSVWWDEAVIEKTDFIQDNVLPGVINLVDSIVTGLEHLSGENFSHADSYASLFGTSANQTGLATRLAFLESLLSPGVTAVEDYEYVDDTGDISDDWSVTETGAGAGHFKVNGHQLTWVHSGYGSRNAYARWIGTNQHTNTDNQIVTAVVGSTPEYYDYHRDLFIATPFYGANVLRARLADDELSEVDAIFYGNGVIVLGCYVDGDWTEFCRSEPGARPRAGATIGLYVGSALDERHFVAQINGQAELSWIDSDNISSMGASNRGHGQGNRVMGYLTILLWSYQAAGGSLNSYGAADA